MKPDTHLGENSRQIEESDDQTTPGGYYAWLAEPQSSRAKEDQRLLGLIKHAWLESGGVYGYRKIHDEALAIYGDDKKTIKYYQSAIFKGYILKRRGRTADALKIVEEQLAAGWQNPITLYNKGCYLYLLQNEKRESAESIKKLIHEAITCTTTDDPLRKKQMILRDIVAQNQEPDLEGLFNEGVREAIAALEIPVQA